MKTLYIECAMGAAGDMLMGALLELSGDPDGFLDRLNNIGIGVSVSADKTTKCGITGTHVTVKIGGKVEGEHSHDHDHEHSHEHGHSHDHSHGDYHGITHLIEHLQVSDKVKADALAVYKLIAEAESHAHGVSVDKIHFHEVGELDAVADIVGVCMLIEELRVDRILASAVNVGSGHVRCAHGILPVPAPATAHILHNTPIYSDDHIQSELCTPTGAALLKHFVGEFGKMPVINVEKMGYGMGTKDFDKANCVRIYLGRTDKDSMAVAELLCNLDDMTPEAISFVQHLLLDKGALDVHVTPVIMKKGRAGHSLACMCRVDEKDKMLSLIFKHTTTLGVREYTSRRWAMKKDHKTIQTELGAVDVKESTGFGVTKIKPEYEAVAKIALERGLTLQEVLKIIEKSGG